MPVPNKWYYIDWVYKCKSGHQYGLIISYYGVTLATPLFALSYNTNPQNYIGFPRFGWGIWRRKDIIEGDFLYKYHN